MNNPNERDGRRVWAAALGLVLVFPIVGFLVGVGVPVKYQGDLVAAVEQDIGRPLTDVERQDVTIDAYCADPSSIGDEACGDLAFAALLRVISFASLIFGVLLLGLIVFTSRRASHDREALVRLFKPSLYLTLTGIIALVIADGLIALGVVYLGLGVFAGRVYPILILAIAAGVLFGVVAVIRAMLLTKRRARTYVVGVNVNAIEEPALHEFVGSIADELHSERPQNIVVGLDPQYFVTEADVAGTNGHWEGTTLYVSLTLNHILTVGELRTVIGHELGHFRGDDTRFSQQFYPIYRGVGEALAGLAVAGGSGARALALLPALWLLELFVEGFAIPERAISRQRELAADQAGIEAGSAEELGSSLVKITAFSPLWDQVVDALGGGSGGAPKPANAGDRFVELVRAAAGPAALEGIDDRPIAHPTDSHPPLADRLAAAGLSEGDVATTALDVEPRESAESLIIGTRDYELSLTAWVEARIPPVPEPAPAPAAT
ncbi:MAG: M48 family metallopeptidase [Chloroflexota bacterium]